MAMNEEGFAHFLRAQGLRVFECAGGLWVEKRKLFLESFPSHRRLHLKKPSLFHLFLRGAAVIRYTCENGEGEPSFEYVCSADNFSLHTLAPEARRRTRRGLEVCEIRPVEFDLLARYGCSINRSTLQRQGRAGRPYLTDENLWKRFMLACAHIPGIEAFGAFIDSRFVGFSISVSIDDYSYLHHTQAGTEDLKHSPINALTYFVTKTMLERPGIKHVSQGLESFMPLPDVEKFKLSMGFQKRALWRRVIVNPFASPLFSPPAVWFARKALGAFRPGLAEDLQTFSLSLAPKKQPLASMEALEK